VSDFQANAPARRPGGRAATVVANVHRAASELLNEVGYDAFQLTEVAARAGVNKTTVYRRWPTKGDLVSDLLLSLTDHDPLDGSQGDLQSALVALLREVIDSLRMPLMQAVLRASLDGAIDPDVRSNFWAMRMERSSGIIVQAIDGGLLPPTTNARSVLEQAASPIYFRQFVTGESITDEDLHTFARRAIETARADH
jgi:AcrR family transcriptional regulator